MIHRVVSQKADFVIYTDADLLSRKIAGLLMVQTDQGPVAQVLCEAVTPHFRMCKFNKRNRSSDSKC